MENAIFEKAKTEAKRIKRYFPFRIVWLAISPNGEEYVTGANTTRLQYNYMIRKGWTVYEVSN